MAAKERKDDAVASEVIYDDGFGEVSADEGSSRAPYFDYHDAIIQIEMLFQSHILSFGYKEYSLETYVDRRFFSEWKAREGCRDTDEMRQGLNIDGILRSAEPSEGEILTYLQYTINIAELCRRSFNNERAEGYDFDIRNYTELLSRIREILRRLGYEIRYVPEKEFIFLVPHDPAADSVSAPEGDPMQAALTEYRSSSARGHLGKKRELLMKLGSIVDSFPDNLKVENAVLSSRIGFLLNSLGIRMGEEGDSIPDKIAAMGSEEVEEWYDETYQMMLLRILQRENAERIERVDRLASDCGIGISAISEDEMAKILNMSPEEFEAAAEEQHFRMPAEEEVRDVAPRAEAKDKHSARNAVIAVIIADILFALFVLWYMFILKK